MASKPQATLADYFIIAISPAMIIVLITSLAYFLIEIIYQGQFEGRMQWTMFWFIMATVLIARIKIEGGLAYAGLYGTALAIAVWLALGAFVEYSNALAAKLSWLFNAIIMAIIWWAAHKLTYDCTFIDESTDPSKQGLMEVSGLSGEVDDEAEEDPEKPKKKSRKNLRKSWWKQYKDYRERKKKQPHAPGVWIIYFSMAALPIFGLGQSLIPAEESGRRVYTFWLMALYVAAGLGLLLTTSFLGLRRYLRHRKLKMPPAIAGVWLSLGGVLVVGLLVVAAVMPRPNAEYSVVDAVDWVASEDRDASDYSPSRKGAGKGEGRASKDSSDDPDAKPGEQGAQKDEEGKGSVQSDKNKSDGKGGKGKGKQDQGKGQDKGDDDEDSNSSQSSQDSPEENKKNESSRGESEESSENSSDNGSEESSSSSPTETLSNIADAIGPILKVIVYIVAALVGLYFLIRYLANFTSWAKDLLNGLRSFWESLFGRKTSEEESEGEEEQQEVAARPRPFSDFPNPFRFGKGGRSADELVRYSFAALESWAWERQRPRSADATPHEFAEQLGESFPAMTSDFDQLANLYSQDRFSTLPISDDCLPELQRFWERLGRA